MILNTLTSPVGKRVLAYSALAVLLVYLFGSRSLSAAYDNGFDMSRASIPVEEIHHGGPPKDGIPAIDNPRFVSPGEAGFLAPEDRVMAMVRKGVAKAYPIKILNYHEIVNDRFAGEAVVVSYCPLCGTGMAFSSEIDGRDASFGVSGLLYNSDVLLYDRETESLWSQITQKAVSGPLVGTELKHLAASHTTWRDWRERHPDTLVLSTQTGYNRDYSRTPYAGYEDSGRIWFPVANRDKRYHPKELVIGLDLDGQVKAYPFAELSQHDTPFADRVADREITIQFDPENRTGRIFDAEGDEIPTVIAFWFAWAAFHPDTAVFEAS
ncbi:MAG: hypothetical protein MAG794_01658 [Gammaproteobacteria bacterium]|nr:hypothetical protein [Gammaproteobacteria bacterium]